MICNKCGTENDDKNKFCKKCGKKLNNNNKIIIATICCLIVICGIIINLDNHSSHNNDVESFNQGSTNLATNDTNNTTEDIQDTYENTYDEEYEEEDDDDLEDTDDTEEKTYEDYNYQNDDTDDGDHSGPHVDIYTEGKWTAHIGNKTYKGEDDKMIFIHDADEVITATVQKDEDNKKSLDVEIVDNGLTLTSKSTSKKYGIVKLKTKRWYYYYRIDR